MKWRMLSNKNFNIFDIVSRWDLFIENFDTRLDSFISVMNFFFIIIEWKIIRMKNITSENICAKFCL